MASIDLKSNIKLGVSLTKIARTTSGTGTSFDVADYDSVCFVVDSGAWTDGTHTFVFQESDDDSTFSAVADGDLAGSEPVVDGATDDDQQYYVGYEGNKRYVRVVQTITATPSTGAVIGGYVVYGNPKNIPAN
jgi:hypothetical protein